MTGTDPQSPEPGVVRRLQARAADVLAERRRVLQADGRRLSDEDLRQLGQSGIADVVRDHVVELLAAGSQAPASDVQRRLAEAVYARLFGAGRLQPLLDDPEIEDIIINGCDEVWLTYADGRKRSAPPVAESDAELVQLVQSLAAYSGLNPRPFDAANPEVDVRLPDGSRLSATQRVCERPAVAIRRHRLRRVFLADLVDNGTMTADVASFLSAAVRRRFSIVIAGETGAGKTTLLQALINEIPPDERLVIVEQSRELNVRAHRDLHPDVVEFEATVANSEGHGLVGMAQLVRRTLRMAPDRVIVGEVLGPEVVAMMNAMTQGNEGSLSTIHAADPRGVFHRIAVYAMQSAEQMRWETAHALMAGALDFVVFIRKLRVGIADVAARRIVSDVLEVAGWDGARVQASAIYAPGGDGRAARVHGVQVLRSDKLAEAGWQDAADVVPLPTTWRVSR